MRRVRNVHGGTNCGYGWLVVLTAKVTGGKRLWKQFKSTETKEAVNFAEGVRPTAALPPEGRRRSGCGRRTGPLPATPLTARALWYYALHQDPPLVNQVVTEGLTFKAGANGTEGSTKVPTVAQCRQILTKIEPDYRSSVALMLFAGIQPEEVAGEGKAALLWEHVNNAENILASLEKSRSPASR